MKTEIVAYRGCKYLYVIRPAGATFDDIKATRQEMQALLKSEAIERVLSDCRAVNLEGMNLIDADTFAMEQHDDLPACKKFAVICQPSSSGMYQHCRNICSIDGVDLRFFTEPKAAKVWLCDE